jgi:hypothetical protein
MKLARIVAAMVVCGASCALALVACGSSSGAGATGEPDAATDVVTPPMDGSLPHDGGSTADHAACEGGLTLCAGACVDPATDSKNCGGCGAVCSATAPSTAQCMESHCLITLVSEPGTADGLAVDGTYAYYTNDVKQVLAKVPIAGGAASQLASGVTGSHLRVFGGYVYVLQLDAIVRVPVGGGAVETVVAQPSGNFTDIAIDTSGLYVAGFYSLSRTAPDGGALVAVGAGPQIASPSSIALDDSFIYAAEGQYVTKTSKTAAPDAGPLQLAWMQPAADLVVVGPTDVYWTVVSNVGPPAMWRVSTSGGQWMQVAGDYFVSMVADGTSVYAAGQGLTKVVMATGAASVFFSKAGDSLAVDPQSVYWTTSLTGVGNVYRLTPK